MTIIFIHKCNVRLQDVNKDGRTYFLASFYPPTTVIGHRLASFAGRPCSQPVILIIRKPVELRIVLHSEGTIQLV